MKNLKKILSLATALALCLGLCGQAMAANMIGADGTGRTTVELTADAANLSVTLPTGLPVTVKADGSIIVADDARIVNNSPAPVKVSGVSVEAVSPWELVGWETDFSNEKLNSRRFALEIQDAGVAVDGSCAAVFNPVPAKGSVGLSYDAKAAARDDKASGTQVAKVVFTVGWDEAPRTYTLSCPRPTPLSSDGDDVWIDLKDANGRSVPYSQWRDNVTLNKTDYMGLQGSDSGNSCYIVPLACGVTHVTVEYDGWTGSVDVLTYDDGTIPVRLTHRSGSFPYSEMESTAHFVRYDESSGILWYALDENFCLNGFASDNEWYIHRGDTIWFGFVDSDDGYMGNTDWFQSCSRLPISFSSEKDDLHDQEFVCEEGEPVWTYNVPDDAADSRYLMNEIPVGTEFGIRLKEW